MDLSVIPGRCPVHVNVAVILCDFPFSILNNVGQFCIHYLEKFLLDTFSKLEVNKVTQWHSRAVCIGILCNSTRDHFFKITAAEAMFLCK